MNKNKKAYIIISVVFYIVGACVQMLAFILSKNSFINTEHRVAYLFISVLIAAVADIFIVKIIPPNMKVLKYIIYFHAAVGIIGNIVFWLEKIFVN